MNFLTFNELSDMYTLQYFAEIHRVTTDRPLINTQILQILQAEMACFYDSGEVNFVCGSHLTRTELAFTSRI